MKGGVLIIGSLLWQDGSSQEPWKDVRKQWRESQLVPRNKYIKVLAPIRYGRYSTNNFFPVQINCENTEKDIFEVKTNIIERSNGTMYVKSNDVFPLYTMVLSKDCECKGKLGHAYLCEFSQEIKTIDDVVAQVKELSKAEGIYTNESVFFRKKWGGISILISKKLSKGDSKSAEFSDKLYRKWAEKLGDEAWLDKFECWSCCNILHTCNEKRGTLNIKHLQALDIDQQALVDTFDFILVAVTVPNHSSGEHTYPSASEIAVLARTDIRRYFQKNYENGIRTFQDQEILKNL